MQDWILCWVFRLRPICTMYIFTYVQVYKTTQAEGGAPERMGIWGHMIPIKF